MKTNRLTELAGIPIREKRVEDSHFYDFVRDKEITKEMIQRLSDLLFHVDNVTISNRYTNDKGINQNKLGDALELVVKFYQVLHDIELTNSDTYK